MSEQAFQNPSVAGVFHLPDARRPAVAAAAHKAGLRILEAVAGPLHDSEAVLHKLGRSFSFPDWYGANFDALHDCLTDPDWQPAAGYVLMISGLDTLRTENPEDFRTLIEVLRSASQIRQENGTPFWVLLDTSAPDIPLLPEA